MEQQRSGIPSYQARGELSFELVQATEAAALACAGLLGKGDPEGVSNAAGEAMRRALDRSDMTGTVGPDCLGDVSIGSLPCHTEAVIRTASVATSAETPDARTRTVRIAEPLNLRLTLAPLWRGYGDPTMRVSHDGVWRATRTP